MPTFCSDARSCDFGEDKSSSIAIDKGKLEGKKPLGHCQWKKTKIHSLIRFYDQSFYMCLVKLCILECNWIHCIIMSSILEWLSI